MILMGHYEIMVYSSIHCTPFTATDYSQSLLLFQDAHQHDIAAMTTNDDYVFTSSTSEIKVKSSLVSQFGAIPYGHIQFFKQCFNIMTYYYFNIIF